VWIGKTGREREGGAGRIGNIEEETGEKEEGGTEGGKGGKDIVSDIRRFITS
jgi:hypothetical protein